MGNTLKYSVGLLALFTLTAAASAQWFGGGIQPDPTADFTVEHAALDEAGRPSPDAENGWPAIAAFYGLIDRSAYRVAHQGVPVQGVPDFSRRYLPDTPRDERIALDRTFDLSRSFWTFNVLDSLSWPTPWHDDYDEFLVEFERAHQIISVMRSDDEFATCLDALADVRWINPPESPEFEHFLWHHVLVGALRQAWRDGDLADVRRIVRAHLATAAALMRKPVIGQWIWTLRTNALLFEIQELVTRQPPPRGWADALLEELEGVTHTHGLEVELRGMHLSMLEEIDAEYTGVPGGDGVWIHGRNRLTNILGYMAPTRRQMREIIDDLYLQAIEVGDRMTITQANEIADVASRQVDELAPHAQSLFRTGWGIPSIIFIGPEMYLQWAESTLVTAELVRGMKDATCAMLLIERHRHLTGAYPAALHEVDDPRLNRGPLPHWRQSLIYERRIEDNRHTYVLYLAGSDGIDNGGHCDWMKWSPLAHEPCPDGMDVVFRGDVILRSDPWKRIHVGM